MVKLWFSWAWAITLTSYLLSTLQYIRSSLCFHSLPLLSLLSSWCDFSSKRKAEVPSLELQCPGELLLLPCLPILRNDLFASSIINCLKCSWYVSRFFDFKHFIHYDRRIWLNTRLNWPSCQHAPLSKVRFWANMRECRDCCSSISFTNDFSKISYVVYLLNGKAL